VAIKEKKYELLRFWLLGSWLANELGLDYYFKKSETLAEYFS